MDDRDDGSWPRAWRRGGWWIRAGRRRRAGQPMVEVVGVPDGDRLEQGVRVGGRPMAVPILAVLVMVGAVSVLAAAASVVAVVAGDWRFLLAVAGLGGFGAECLVTARAGWRARRAAAAAVYLTPTRLVVDLDEESHSVRWDELSDVRAFRAPPSAGFWPRFDRNWLALAVDEPPQRPPTEERVRSILHRPGTEQAIDVVARVEVERLQADSLTFLRAVRHYRDQSAARAELGGVGGVRRLTGQLA